MSVLVLHKHTNRSIDYVIQYIGHITGVDNGSLSRVAAVVAKFQKPINRGISCGLNLRNNVGEMTVGWGLSAGQTGFLR